MKYVSIKILIVCLFSSLSLFAKIDLDFSHKRGYYDNSFQLTITAEDPNAIIRYTTNNSKPTASNGSIYNNAINIDETTIVKVYAFTASDESDVRAHSYLFMDDILDDNNLSDHVTDDPDYIPFMETSFKALPIVSLSSNLVDEGENVENETETTAEMFFPDGSRNGFMISCGLHTWGGSDSNPKKHFRLEFKKIYGEGKLKYKLFKQDNYNTTTYRIPPVEEFDKLLLRGGSQDGLNAEYGHESYAQYVRNRVLMDVQIEMGYPAPHGRYVQVFLNGEYVGQYHFMERPDANWFAAYFGGEDTEYEVYKSGDYIDNGNDIWDNLPNQINLSSSASIAQTNNHIDLKQTAAYLNIMSFASGFDWSDDHNALGGGNIVPGNGGYKFIIWDVDFSLGNGGKWSPSNAYNLDFFDSPVDDDGPVPDNLVGNREFNIMMDDNLECSCYNGGILSPDKIDSLYMHRINQITTSLIAESARWGDVDFSYDNGHVQDGNWDVNGEFTTELNRIRSVFMAQRTNEMIEHYEDNGLSSDLDGVVFNKYGGLVNDNYALSLINLNSNSEIYYTTDGSDPRAVGGSISNSAILYSSPIILSDEVITINARVRNNSGSNTNVDKWSGMCPRKFYAGQDYAGLEINEIHYNPNDSIYFNNATGMMDTVSGTSFEFIEIKNTGNSLIKLEDVSFTRGVTAKFEAATIINPDDFIVIAEDSYWFQQKYGFTPDATYIGKLSNSGEGLEMVDPSGNVIDSLTFRDSAPWDSIPDDGEYSLALILNSANNTDAANWNSQSVFVSPGAENQHCPGALSNNYFATPPTCIGSSDGSIFTDVFGGDGGPYNYLWNDGTANGLQFGISAGTYVVEITDNSNCRRIDTIVLNDPSEMMVNSNITDQFYYNTADASATVNVVSGGTAPFNYLWNNGNETNSINNVNPGAYNVEITDANNCSVNEQITIASVDCSTLDLSFSTTDENAFQANNGTAFAIVNGGYSPYNYLWNNGATSSIRTNLSPGNYTVTITDNRGCETSGTAEILQYDCNGLNATVNTADQIYVGENDGTASVFVNGGTSPYSYIWSNGATSQSINQLAPGNYFVTIIGGDDCEIVENFVINPLDCSSLNVSINQNNESAYQANNGNATANVSGGFAPYSYQWTNGSTSSTINNLNPGNYDLTVTDERGCTTTETIEILPYDCMGLDVNVSTTNQTYFNSNNGAAAAVVSGGFSPYNYLWSNGSTAQSINNLAPGSYTLTVTGSDNCAITEAFNIDEINCNSTTINETINNETCFGNNDGSIYSNVSGGNAPYTYSWSNGATTTNITNLNASNYSLTVTDNTGCITTESFTVPGPLNPLSLTANVTDISAPNNADGAIDLTVNGGFAPFSYFWANGADSQDISNLTEGNYWVIVTDNNGCSVTDSYVIETSTNTFCEAVSSINIINPTVSGVTLFWNANNSASNYEVKYRISGSTTWLTEIVTTNLKVLSNLNACATYEIQIVTNCSNGASSLASDIATFNTIGCNFCDPVSNLTAINETQESVILQWDLVAGADYILYTREFGASFWNENYLNFPFAILFTLDPCSSYEWYVIVNCDNSMESEASSTKQFTTLCPSPRVAGFNDDTNSSFNSFSELKLFPNPVVDYLTIETDVFKQANSLNVYNANGQLMYLFENEDFTNQFRINTFDFPNGVYWLDVRYEDGTFELEKFIKR